MRMGIKKSQREDKKKQQRSKIETRETKKREKESLLMNETLRKSSQRRVMDVCWMQI